MLPDDLREEFASRSGPAPSAATPAFLPATFLRPVGSRRLIPVVNSFSVAASLKLTITMGYYR
jgi:hypothetical protein